MRILHRYRRRGFSLVEALVALSVTAMAGSVLLLSVESSLQTTTDAVDRTIADGIAQQLLNEILTKQYVEDGESGDGSGSGILGPLGATAWELAGAGTSRFNDTDDYAGYITQPLKDIWGETLGTGNDASNLRPTSFRVWEEFFQNWRAWIDVYYVNPNDHTLRSASATAFRAIEVHVERIGTDGIARPLARRKRIIAYVPPSS